MLERNIFLKKALFFQFLFCFVFFLFFCLILFCINDWKWLKMTETDWKWDCETMAEYKLTMWPPSMIACACVAASLRGEAQRNDPSTAASVTDDVLGQLQRITLIENVTALSSASILFDWFFWICWISLDFFGFFHIETIPGSIPSKPLSPCPAWLFPFCRLVIQSDSIQSCVILILSHPYQILSFCSNPILSYPILFCIILPIPPTHFYPSGSIRSGSLRLIQSHWCHSSRTDPL